MNIQYTKLKMKWKLLISNCLFLLYNKRNYKKLHSQFVCHQVMCHDSSFFTKPNRVGKKKKNSQSS